MYPDLFSLGPLAVHSYGTMMVIGFFAGLSLARIRVAKHELTWEQTMDLCFYLLLWGIIGAKVLFWIIFYPYFIQDLSILFSSPLDFVKGLGTGFVFFGSVIGGAIVLIIYTRKRKLSISSTMDFLAPSLALGHAVGRIGCFLAGCCYGKPCDKPWAVEFTHPHTLAPPDVHLHPTQLYESIFLFGLVMVLLVFAKRFSQFKGMIFSLYVFLYTSFRFCIEFLRNDPRGSVFQGAMTSTQLVAILGFFGAAFGMYLSLKKGMPTNNQLPEK